MMKEAGKRITAEPKKEEIKDNTPFR